jgi:hypothetical protein
MLQCLDKFEYGANILARGPLNLFTRLDVHRSHRSYLVEESMLDKKKEESEKQ